MGILNKFCCCCRLEIGGLIFGWLSLIKAISSTIALSFILIEAMSKNENSVQKLDDGYYTQLEHFDGFRLTLINLLCAILLIVGILKRNAIFLLPWLIIHMIYVILCLIIVSFKSSWIINGTDPKILIAMLVAFPFFIYVWLCVLSLYQQLNDTQVIPMTNDTKTNCYENNICLEKNNLQTYYKIENI